MQAVANTTQSLHEKISYVEFLQCPNLVSFFLYNNQKVLIFYNTFTINGSIEQ